MDMENTEDGADGSLTPAHTASHGGHMPETVPPGVLTNFTSTHTGLGQSPQRTSTHKKTVPKVTATQEHCLHQGW